jgi:thioredoxin 1
MNKTILIIASIAILAAVGSFITIAQRATQKNTDSPVQTESTQGIQPTKNTNSLSQTANARYTAFSPLILQDAASKRRVLFFYASWCPTCRPADAAFRMNTAQIPKDVIVVRVNYNDMDTDQEEKDLATKYGITYQHTYVQIDAEGKEIQKWNGGSVEELIVNLQ